MSQNAISFLVTIHDHVSDESIVVSLLMQPALISTDAVSRDSNLFLSLNVIVTNQCGATAERRTSDREVPDSKLACAIWFSP